MSRAGVRADLVTQLETVLGPEWTAVGRARLGREPLTLPCAVVSRIDQDFESATLAGGSLIVAEVTFIAAEVATEFDEDVLDALVDDDGPLDQLQSATSPHWHEVIVTNVRDEDAVVLGLSLWRACVATLRIVATP